MAELVNLRRVRKARARDEQVRHAEEQRARHGLSKAGQALAAHQQARDAARLDGHRLSDGDRPVPSTVVSNEKTIEVL